jgi:hypothetical protein
MARVAPTTGTHHATGVKIAKGDSTPKPSEAIASQLTERYRATFSG